ncbi:hypothetical protein [Candidatus Borreliella tachyglossi]|uniref:hypothetical protein n=1 Tax=Candidatus Borreliella tachyglossi TaxID=1964448 RepID=UPI004042EE15
MAITDRPIYDSASVRIDVDKINFFQVRSISYPMQLNGRMIPNGIGNPYVVMQNRGFARGRFEGSFDMTLLLHDWMIFREYYKDRHYGVFAPEGITFNVSFYDGNGKLRIQNLVDVVLSEHEMINIDDEGGKAIEVKTKGFLLRPPYEYLDKVLVETRNIAQSFGLA